MSRRLALRTAQSLRGVDLICNAKLWRRRFDWLGVFSCGRGFAARR